MSSIAKKIILAKTIVQIKINQIFKKRDLSSNILIIKPDAIGDYIIFRNFLSYIINSDKFKNKKITLIGNEIWKDFAEEFDGYLIHKFISINYKTLNNDWFKVFNKIDENQYETVISFCYSRSFISDIFAYISYSGNKVGLNGDNLRINPLVKFIFNKIIYHKLPTVPLSKKSEFDYNKFLTEFLIGEKIEIEAPFLYLNKGSRIDNYRINNSIILAPGAGVSKRQSLSNQWALIITYLLNKYNICLIGSKDDQLLVDEILSKVVISSENSIINLCGKLSLKDIPEIINNGICTICNDSAMYHLSAALNKPTLCLSGGGHFERFITYINRKNVKVCYSEMSCFNCNWFCKYKIPQNMPYPCIINIEFDSIIENFNILERGFEQN